METIFRFFGNTTLTHSLNSVCFSADFIRILLLVQLYFLCKNVSVKELRETILEDNNPVEMSKIENNPFEISKLENNLFEMSKIENKDERTDESDMRNDITSTPRFRSGSCIMVGIKE